MHEQPQPNFPLSSMPEQHPPKKVRRWRKPSLWIFIIVGLVLVAATSAYLFMNKPDASNSPTTRSVTYYYRDGKTVLWQGTRLAEADSPAFVHAVADDLISRYGEPTMQQNGDWKIVTTLDQSLQEVAKQQINAQGEQLTKQKVQDAALIAQDVTTGQIVSWVGGLEDKVFYNGKDRLSTETQPASLALPLVYAAYMNNNTNVNADTIMEDTQRELPGYMCNNKALPQQGGDCLFNYDRKYLGQVTLRQALAGLRSVPAVQAMTSVIPNDTSVIRVNSINKAISTIESMMGDDRGYRCYKSETGTTAVAPTSEEMPCYAAAAIGDGVFAKPSNLINAFSTLSNKGERLAQAYWLRVEREGKVLDEWKNSGGEQAIKEATASTISDILSDQSSSYLNKKTYFSIDGKTKVSTITGVVNDGATASAVQYTAKYAVGFWAFNDQGQITGFAELFTLPATYGWLSAAKEK